MKTLTFKLDYFHGAEKFYTATLKCTSEKSCINFIQESLLKKDCYPDTFADSINYSLLT